MNWEKPRNADQFLNWERYKLFFSSSQSHHWLWHCRQTWLKVSWYFTPVQAIRIWIPSGFHAIHVYQDRIARCLLYSKGKLLRSMSACIFSLNMTFWGHWAFYERFPSHLVSFIFIENEFAIVKNLSCNDCSRSLCFLMTYYRYAELKSKIVSFDSWKLLRERNWYVRKGLMLVWRSAKAMELVACS